jgi:XTP/dITP diphosphohydrolase
MNKYLEAFNRLLDIMDNLRANCPWDKKQTFETLRTLTIEEVYELAEAIINNDKQEIKKELGDILLHIVFYARIGSETGDFDIAGVINSLCDKLVYRHPHIYGEVKVSNDIEVSDNWEKLKLNEDDDNGKTVLGGVPGSLPAMIKEYRIQDKARGAGFDWDVREQVWDKINEEFNELKHEIKSMNHERTEKEFGDLFFSLINAARLYGINPENALERTNQKFIRRFSYLESKTIKNGKPLKEMNLDEMNIIWEESKQTDE